MTFTEFGLIWIIVGLFTYLTSIPKNHPIRKHSHGDKWVQFLITYLIFGPLALIAKLIRVVAITINFILMLMADLLGLPIYLTMLFIPGFKKMFAVKKEDLKHDQTN